MDGTVVRDMIRFGGVDFLAAIRAWQQGRNFD